MKTGFFQESEGQNSFIRLISFLVFLLHVGIDYILLTNSYYKDKPYDYLFIMLFIVINLIFLIAEFYPKYLQKIIELGASKFSDFRNAVAPIKPGEMK